MQLTTRQATTDDLRAYTLFLQKAYETFYTDETIGLTKECFSLDIFQTKDTQSYLKKNLLNNDKQLSLLVFDNTQLVGSIAVAERDNDYELKGFYVAKKYQGKGMGKMLWGKVLAFATEKKDITCDVYAHNTKTISIYEKWGFIKDKNRGTFMRHWPEWPANVQVKVLYMRYPRLSL